MAVRYWWSLRWSMNVQRPSVVRMTAEGSGVGVGGVVGVVVVGHPWSHTCMASSNV